MYSRSTKKQKTNTISPLNCCWKFNRYHSKWNNICFRKVNAIFEKKKGDRKIKIVSNFHFLSDNIHFWSIIFLFRSMQPPPQKNGRICILFLKFSKLSERKHSRMLVLNARSKLHIISLKKVFFKNWTNPNVMQSFA